MSFRYTNDLIGTLRHRLLIEAAQRFIARRTFVGVSRGIEVRCSGFGGVLSIRFKPSPTFSESAAESFYYLRRPSGAPSEETSASSSTDGPLNSADRELRLDRVSESVKAAVWMAQQQRRGARAEAIQRSLQGSTAASSSHLVGLKRWFEDDPDAMVGLLPHQHLSRWCATPWMTAVQYGLPNPDVFLATSPAAAANGVGSGEKHGDGEDRESTLPKVLSLEETNPLRIPIGSLHHLHSPALLQFEVQQQREVQSPVVTTLKTTDTAAMMEQAMPTRSRVDLRAIRSAQRREMRQDETKFWERVELIRRAQISSTNQHSKSKGGSKRAYKDLSNTLKDDVEEKVELRFTS